MNCIACGSELGGRKRKWCNQKCRYRAKYKSIAVREPRACAWCEEVFTTHNATHEFCSETCRNNKKRLLQYGINAVGIQRLIESQYGLCAACGEPLGNAARAPHVDHCHESGRVRSILHAQCNVGIGMAHENDGKLFLWGLYLARNTFDLRSLCG